MKEKIQEFFNSIVHKAKQFFAQKKEVINAVFKQCKRAIAFALSFVWDYFKRVLVWLDQGVNVVFLAGYEDESLSSRFYRWSLKEEVFWKIPSILINTLFFFDYIEYKGKKRKHCEKSYLNECARLGQPVEMRVKNANYLQTKAKQML